MFCFTIHATPDPDREQDAAAEGSAGAYVNCWIDYADEEGAEVLARHYLTEAGWLPGKTEDVGYLERDGCSEDEHDLQCFDEAVEYGSSLCFHLYPPEGEECEE